MKKEKVVICCPICGNVCPNCDLGGGACSCCDCVMPEECKNFEEFCQRNKYANKDILLGVWNETTNLPNINP